MKIFNFLNNKKGRLITVVFLFIILIVALGLFLNNKKQENNLIPAEEQLAKQAEEFCRQNGGQVERRLLNDGREQSMCVFADQKECATLEMLSGSCPVGGRVVFFTGPYNYCLSLGGEYLEKKDVLIEEKFTAGDCLLKDGQVFPVMELYKKKNN